jgi:hypothetical protein
VLAWIGLSLSFTMISVIVVAGVLGMRASSERNYRESADPCAGMEVGPVATVLGIPGPRLQQNPRADGCSYDIEEQDGTFGGGGYVELNYFDNALVAWLGWRYQLEEDSREVLDLGSAARITTQRVTSGPATGCSVRLEVLDSNLIFKSRITTFAEMSARPCDNLDAVSAALIDSARASIAGIAQRP